jgi:hypothetical protein
MERKYQAHRNEREERFRHIMELRAQGLYFSEIATCVGMGERSVRQWVKQGGPPLLCIVARTAAVSLTHMLPTYSRAGKPVFMMGSNSLRFSVRKAVWLFIREQATLTPQEQEDLTFIRQARGRTIRHLDQSCPGECRLRTAKLCDWSSQGQRCSGGRAHASRKSMGPWGPKCRSLNWSSAPCLAVPSFLSYGNGCSMRPDLCKSFCLFSPSPHLPKHVRLLPSF